MGVAAFFQTFCDELLISSDTRSIIATRCSAICTRLNKDFWDAVDTSGGRYIGSFGRNTANGRVSDIDMIFEMPLSTYNTYNSYVSNGQSALLQAVKRSIQQTYSSTDVRGDGQVVQVTFADGMKFEVLPVFKVETGHYTYADANNGGSWRTTNPLPEIEAIASGDSEANCNLRPLCRMMRAWKYYCNVPINGLLLDTLACRFISDWAYRKQSYLYYDWMTRDFFEYLKNQPASQTVWYAIGSGQAIYNTDNFRYKATLAHNITKEAIALLGESKEWSAKQKWRELYGTRFPE
jgi:hypothetical protein